MKEINKFWNRLCYPWYWLERKIVKNIIYRHIKQCQEMYVTDIYIEDIYPFYLRQTDDNGFYFDQYFKPNIEISYWPIKDNLDMLSIIKLEILKYKLRFFNFNFDYIKVERNIF